MVSEDILLARYKEAAKVIETARLYGLKPTTDSSNVKASDITMSAVGMLLQHQAASLGKLHDVFLMRESLSGVDKELLQIRLDDIASISLSKFYAYRYELLPYIWRQIYSDVLILTTHLRLLQSMSIRRMPGEMTIDFIIGKLDRALVVAGDAGKHLGPSWIRTTLVVLEQYWRAQVDDSERPNKRSKLVHEQDLFSGKEPFGRPALTHECSRYQNWSIEEFEDYMNHKKQSPRPVVFTDLTKAVWPALTDRPWKSRHYLLSKTFDGRRLVPVEVGRSYVDEDWGQEMIPFKKFLERYIDGGREGTQVDEGERRVGYLAQHNLFHQIPCLRKDIGTPDFCWADVPGHPVDPSKNHSPLDEPQLNAWFGPPRTITPLHTDGYHNLLCQVVGTKYVRLYPPGATCRMQPRSPEHGVDMSNTSALDIGILEGWDEQPQGLTDEGMQGFRESLRGIEFWECILEPGDTLLIPMGWWHYVRSLSISFSVSFWWN